MSVWKELLLELVKGIVEATAAWFKSNLHSWIYCLRTLKLIRLQGTKYKEYVLYMYCFFRCVLLGNMPSFVQNKAGYSRSLAKACVKQIWLDRLNVQNKYIQSILKNKRGVLFNSYFMGQLRLKTVCLLSELLLLLRG